MSSQESYGSRLPYRLLVFIVTVIIFFLEAPLIILVIQSFTAESYLAFPPPSYGVRWYKEVLTSEDWLNSISLSLIIAYNCYTTFVDFWYHGGVCSRSRTKEIKKWPPSYNDCSDGFTTYRTRTRAV